VRSVRHTRKESRDHSRCEARRAVIEIERGIEFDNVEHFDMLRKAGSN
jgi:hypothetical protein